MKAEFGTYLLAIALLLAGCDDDTVTSRELVCQSFCNKLESCDDHTDVEGCVRACDEEKTRSDAFLVARSSCVEEASCNVWRGEVGAMGEDICSDGEGCKLNDCTSDALASQMPSSDEATYCGRVVSKLNACDHGLVPSELETNCLQLVPSLSTAYLREVQRCIEVDCEQVRACLDRVGDLFNTDISMYPSQSSPPPPRLPPAVH